MQKCDFAIIGGGITGLLTAYQLSKNHKNISIFEKDEIGSGATSLTTAFITQTLDTEAKDLIEIFGSRKAKLIWQSGGEAIDLIEKIIKKENIKCDFKRIPGYLFAKDKDDLKNLKEEEKAIKRLGYKALYKEKYLDSLCSPGYIEIKNQAKFNIQKFIKGLKMAVKKRGVKIYENTEIKDIDQLEAKYKMITTHLPVINPLQLFAKKGVYKTYLISAQIQKGLVPEAIYMDIESPYHYFRIDPDKSFDSITLGGGDHRIEQKIKSSEKFNELKEYLKQTITPKFKITSKWTGPIIEPSDGIALIGEISPNTLVATGFSGNGMTYSAISAMIFKDLIEKNANPYIKLYDPKRIPGFKPLIKKGVDYTKVFLKNI